MDANLKNILDELPDKPPRSRLEPYREFIEELRSRGRTYRDIAEILAEKCSVKVTGSGIHDFVRTRSRTRVRQAENSPTEPKPRPVGKPAAMGTGAPAPRSEEIQRKMRALKAHNTAAEPLPPSFEYDPDQPLRLKK